MVVNELAILDVLMRNRGRTIQLVTGDKLNLDEVGEALRRALDAKVPPPQFVMHPPVKLPTLAASFAQIVYRTPNVQMVLKLRGEIGDGLAGNVKHVADSVFEIFTTDEDDTVTITLFDACDVLWFEFQIVKPKIGALTPEEIEALDKQPAKTEPIGDEFG